MSEKGISNEGKEVSIFDMEIHDMVVVHCSQMPCSINVLRVAGGWLYMPNCADPVFVAYPSHKPE